MKFRETIYTETDERGRVIRRTRTVEQIYDPYGDYEYDRDTRGGYANPYRSSDKRIKESYDEYRRSQEW